MSKKDTQFKSGSEWNGNAAGRPLGGKNKLSEDFLEELTKNFAKHGKDAIDRVVRDSPVQYLKLIANLVPREFLLEVTQEKANTYVINANPVLTNDEWLLQHGLPIISDSEPAMLENISPDQIIDQLKQES